MLILISIGVVCGPLLGIFNQTTLMKFAPFISAVALTYILFDGGMNLDIKSILINGPKGILLGVLGFVSSVVSAD